MQSSLSNFKTFRSAIWHWLRLNRLKAFSKAVKLNVTYCLPARESVDRALTLTQPTPWEPLLFPRLPRTLSLVIRTKFNLSRLGPFYLYSRWRYFRAITRARATLESAALFGITVNERALTYIYIYSWLDCTWNDFPRKTAVVYAKCAALAGALVVYCARGAQLRDIAAAVCVCAKRECNARAFRNRLRKLPALTAAAGSRWQISGRLNTGFSLTDERNVCARCKRGRTRVL